MKSTQLYNKKKNGSAVKSESDDSPYFTTLQPHIELNQQWNKLKLLNVTYKWLSSKVTNRFHVEIVQMTKSFYLKQLNELRQKKLTSNQRFDKLLQWKVKNNGKNCGKNF